jgi:pyridoxamine 5'-phosphate oxidase family protein
MILARVLASSGLTSRSRSSLPYRRVRHEISSARAVVFGVQRTEGSDVDMAFNGFSSAERAYMAGQRLGRLATVSPAGIVGNAPVTFSVRSDDTIDIGGMRMGSTKKFRNVAAGSRVAFVVDDLAPGPGWNPRYLEIRGTAEALTNVEPRGPGFSREIIRIHPDWVRSFGLGDTG